MTRLDELSKKISDNNQGLASRAHLKPPSTSTNNQTLRVPTTFPAPNSAQRAAPPPIQAASTSSSQARKKVTLQPGHSPLDWAQLNRTQPKHKLRGVPLNFPPPQIVRVTKDELNKHKSRSDCWTCINGKVFNITPYLHFHPGGVDEIMKCAGRDGTALFNKYHAWVNVDRMLENCIVGVFTNS
ncbi:uncharacterized protein LODBEIA_P27540 [Lodderomyces beijingensis]|uniref:Cytochrome b5 heme-binding domain-containing protein n=1 Tax=Lodderomyces beijingensis TaxID=1775926 RepID=A0ABP0ZK64_9ASCO